MAGWVYRPVRYRGASAWELEAGAIRGIVVPSRGGKLASLRVDLEGRGPVELLYQPLTDSLAPPVPSAPFLASASWGWDDLFPTVAPCEYGQPPWAGLPLADHGELWSSPAAFSAGSSRCSATLFGTVLPYRFEKVLIPVPGGLRIEWTAENLSAENLSYLWSAHPLFAVEADSFVVGPGGDISVDYETPRGAALACMAAGMDAAGMDAAVSRRERTLRMPGKGAGSAAKFFYLNPVGPEDLPLELHRPSAGLVLRMAFDVRALPYLGVWVNAGGWEDQYTLALEPTTGRGDSLADARSNGTARILPPRSVASWWIELTVSC